MSIFQNILSPDLASALSGIEKQFIMMRSSGASVRDIAKKLKKSPHTICKWNKKFSNEIISARNFEFCDLQKKIIESKTERLNILKNEFKKASVVLKQQKIDANDVFGGYNKFLELYIKLSELVSACESEILAVGVKFKDNIEPEVSFAELKYEKAPDTVADESNSISCNPEEKVIDNSMIKPDEQHNATKCNTSIPKKYEAYSKHRVK